MEFVPCVVVDLRSGKVLDFTHCTFKTVSSFNSIHAEGHSDIVLAICLPGSPIPKRGTQVTLLHFLLVDTLEQPCNHTPTIPSG